MRKDLKVRAVKAGLDPIRVPSELDVAWAAGIYEGEGSCCQSGPSHAKGFAAAISQKDPELLYRLRDMFGGSIKAYVNGGYDIFKWTACGDLGRIFLAAVYPYLTARRKEQVDRTSALRFVGAPGVLSAVPQSLPSATVTAIKKQIKVYSTEMESAAAKRKVDRQKAHYEEKSKDPKWMEKRRKGTAAWRSKSKSIVNQNVIEMTS